MITTWKEKQAIWKRAIMQSPMSQNQFAIKYGFDRVSLNNWLNGKTRANPESELRMDKIIQGFFYNLSMEE